MLAELAYVRPVKVLFARVYYRHYTCTLGFTEPSSVSFKVHTLKFFQNVLAIHQQQYKKQYTLKHAFNSAFAKQWLTVFIVGQPTLVPVRAMLFEGRR